MPVQIKSYDDSSDPRVINLEDYENGRANFSLHYYYTEMEAAFTRDVIDVPWNSLQAAVDNYVLETSVPENEVALRFVHCFDTVNHALYYRLQICQMVLSSTPPPPGTLAVYDLVTTGAKWYDVKNYTLSPTLHTSLGNAPYLNNFYYKDEPQATTMQRLMDGPGIYVKNLTLPWAQEIKLMYQENGSPVDATINFAASSYIEPPQYSNVMWPHGMIAYLKDSEGTLLLDDESYVSIFHNKGADLATQCPPNCNIYIMPVL